ncbi:hypothetical protein UlMin_006283 [Ulmus minor]
MKVPMDNSLDLPRRERVQHLFNKNVELENRRRRSAQARIPSDPNVWQQMRENYEAIILDDHVFAEQHDIESALWQLHYKRIEELRAHLHAAVASNDSATSQAGKSSSRPDRITKIRSHFKTFLSEATGFYHDLMLKIRAKYGLPLSYFSDDPQNEIVNSGDGNKSSEMKKGVISCHRCLIYLGDLSRYKGLYGEGDSKNRDFAAASSYYLQASALCPSSGNPHHQLAILANYSEDELVAIYRYFRSLAVDNPFSTARDNLIIAFEKNRQSFSQLPGDHKDLSVKIPPARLNGKGRGRSGAMASSKANKTEASIIKESASSISDTFRAFCIRFVRLNGILFTRTSLETFGDVLSMVRSDLLELLSFGPEETYNFGSSAADNRLVIVRLITILIFTAHNVNKESGNQSYAEILRRPVLLQNAYTAIFDFMGNVLEKCVQLCDPSACFLLSGALVFMEWLACHPDITIGTKVEEKQAAARSFFWKNCIILLNKLSSSGSMTTNEDEEACFFSNMSKYDENETANRLALWEDFELRGFGPLVPAQLILDFSSKQGFGGDNSNKEKEARIQRIISAGKSLVSVVQIGQEGIYFDPGMKKFTYGAKPPISSDIELNCSLQVPASNGMGQENPLENQMNLGVLQPKAESYMEGDEEDEVIVFKPSTLDKHADAISPKLPLYDAFRPSNSTSQGDPESCIGSMSPPLHDVLPPDAFQVNFGPLTSLANTVPQQLQSIQPSTSRWMLEQQASINGLNKLKLMEGSLVMKPVLQDRFESFEPAAYSVPRPNLSAHHEHSGQVFDSVIPSKSDSIMSYGANSDYLLGNLSSRKNPVSRPTRHFGPPPGFSQVPPKPADESLTATNLKADFTGLDGVQLQSSIKSTAQSYNRNNNLMGLTFPFPGKQVPTLQAQFESQKNWQDFQVPNHLKHYQEQQQQHLQKVNQDLMLSEQYQGQSLWESRFIV